MSADVHVVLSCAGSTALEMNRSKRQ